MGCANDVEVVTTYICRCGCRREMTVHEDGSVIVEYHNGGGRRYYVTRNGQYRSRVEVAKDGTR